jgi:hypothetical protein
LATIFFFHQCVHFWGASTENSDVGRPGSLQFSNGQKLSIQDNNGNLHNHRICNGRDYINLTDITAGTLAVQCLPNNNKTSHPTVHILFFNISVAIPNNITIIRQGEELESLIEITAPVGPNVTISIESSVNVALITGVDGNTQVDIFV